MIDLTPLNFDRCGRGVDDTDVQRRGTECYKIRATVEFVLEKSNEFSTINVAFWLAEWYPSVILLVPHSFQFLAPKNQELVND